MRSAVQTPDPIWESLELLTDGRQFTVENLEQLYKLVSSAYRTTNQDMIYTVLKKTNKTQLYKKIIYRQIHGYVKYSVILYLLP